jgi:hypothetical protein
LLFLLISILLQTTVRVQVRREEAPADLRSTDSVLCIPKADGC